MLGETPGSFPARNWLVAEGRAISETDVDNARDVCVLGSGLAKTVFPFGSPVGERVKLNGINYTVVGLLAPKGGSLNGEQDNFAVIPITTAINRSGRWWRSLTILVQARNAATYEDCVEQVRGILRVVRKVPPGAEDDFELFSNDSLINQFNNFTKAVRIGVAVVSSIALLAAGIGIMNIMLVSVNERTREIGLRKAVGAPRRAILAQFLLEASLLCVLGGIAGVLIGILTSFIISKFSGWATFVTSQSIILAFIFSAGIGVIFGFWPAYQASLRSPIEALRYE